jgi:hypothetical protein
MSVVAYACNPKYLGSRDGEDHDLRPAQAKGQWDLTSTNKLSMVVYKASPWWEMWDSILNITSKKGLGCGSSERASTNRVNLNVHITPQVLTSLSSLGFYLCISLKMFMWRFSSMRHEFSTLVKIRLILFELQIYK